MNIPKSYGISGDVQWGNRGSWLLRLRWWAIRKLAGKRLTVLVNAHADHRGFIKVGGGRWFFAEGCRDLQLTMSPADAAKLYHDRPYNVVRETW